MLSDDKEHVHDQFGLRAFEGSGSQGFGNFDFDHHLDIFEDFWR